jgi:hypothetical protein
VSKISKVALWKPSRGAILVERMLLVRTSIKVATIIQRRLMAEKPPKKAVILFKGSPMATAAAQMLIVHQGRYCSAI